jgi:photosystem II stability/assembly factor-like uncharacterized protein
MTTKLSAKHFLFAVFLTACLQSGCSENSNSISAGLNMPVYHISQLPKGYNFYSIYFTGEYTGWAVGKGGVIYHTIDAGNSWFPQNSFVEDNLYNVLFIDRLNGWIGGENNILSTTDGGNTWVTKLPAKWFGYLVSIEFIDKNTGWVSGTADGRIYHTTDAGATWSIQQTDSLGRVIDLSFVNNSIGYSISIVKGIYKTSDGGQSWNKCNQPRFCSAIHFQNSKKGFAGNNVMPCSEAFDKANIFITEDGGSTWSAITIPTTESVWKIAFNKNNAGFAIAGGLSVYYASYSDVMEHRKLIFTPNGGYNWNSAGFESLGKEVINFNLINHNTIGVLTSSNEIYYFRIRNY